MKRRGKLWRATVREALNELSEVAMNTDAIVHDLLCRVLRAGMDVEPALRARLHTIGTRDMADAILDALPQAETPDAQLTIPYDYHRLARIVRRCPPSRPVAA